MTYNNAPVPAPISYQGVMVSSTFNDLIEHRAALIKAISGQELYPVVMENDSAKPGIDVIESSLQMVQKASGYIGVISHRYGAIREDAERNPNRLSLTELEFRDAQRLGRPILLFIMGADHLVSPRDIETDPEKITKLKAFRKYAKLPPNSSVSRIYTVFNNLTEFKAAAIQSIVELRRYLELQAAPPSPPSSPSSPSSPSPSSSPNATAPAASSPDGIPYPPALYAEPPYIGTHEFIGRKAQLDTLNDWASSADPHPILLFEAIGGTGKSMLTWHWTQNYAQSIRNDWAGIFWYSFYERGAVMADFCRRALAYMTGQPLKELNKKKTLELSELLQRQLKARPWLLILDGLERGLVAYHRFDAAKLADEEAGKTDQIAQRDPCDAIRPEDDELLRMLVAADPSKLLLTTRLTPRILLNQASQAIPGVLRERLPGLRPADAEALLRTCGVTGNSQTMQHYLQRHCDCHPLVTGIVAGLVNDYFPDRGNFDDWAADPDHGGHLNLAELDLVQKRNHILNTALNALSSEGRQLLSSLALLSESADTELLQALNPHLLPRPEAVDEPEDPREQPIWVEISEEEQQIALTGYEENQEVWQHYQDADKAWQQKWSRAQRLLPGTVRDLEQRGLLQYDPNTRRYDLHPVVRGTTAGGLQLEDRERFGQPLVDHFSQKTRSLYEDVETLEEIQNELQLIRTLLQMGRYDQAFDAYQNVSNALFFNLEAEVEVLLLLQPFFPNGWDAGIQFEKLYRKRVLSNAVGIALAKLGNYHEALKAFLISVEIALLASSWSYLSSYLTNTASTFSNQNRLVKAKTTNTLALDLALYAVKQEHSNIPISKQEDIFITKLSCFEDLSNMGYWLEAEALWKEIDSMGRDWDRAIYRPGDAEHSYAQLLFWQGKLDEESLTLAEKLARDGKNRNVIRYLHNLRGEWHLEQGQWALAADSFQEAVRMIREVGRRDEESEAFLALSQFHLEHLPAPRQVAEKLANPKDLSAHCPLAELWLAISDHKQATHHALAAYQWAWADGEPYVRHYELDKARALLEQLNVEIPDLPPYDPAKEEIYPWEEKVAAAIEELKAKAEEEEEKEEEEE